MALVALLGDNVVSKSGEVAVSSLSDNDVVGEYCLYVEIARH